jgi:O-antigen ligase
MHPENQQLTSSSKEARLVSGPHKRFFRENVNAAQQIDWLDSTPHMLATMLCLFAPWYLGGRGPNAQILLGTIAWLVPIMTLVLIQRNFLRWTIDIEYLKRRGKDAPNPWKIFAKSLIPAVPLFLFMLIQLISVMNPAYQSNGATLTKQEFVTWLPLVIDAKKSGPAVFLLCALLCSILCLISPAINAPRKLLKIIQVVLVLNASILSFIGLFTKFAGNGLILGFLTPRADYFYATFYYKNHWAAYAILYLGVACSLLFKAICDRKLDSRNANGNTPLALLAVVSLALSIPVSESRSGTLLMLVLGGLISARLYLNIRNTRKKIYLLIGFCIVIFGFSILARSDLHSLVEKTERQIKMADTIAYDQIRLKLGPQITWGMFTDRPLLGWGYHSFGQLFPAYATDYFFDDEGRQTKKIEFAHNDWLQSLAEFGIIGFALLVSGIGAIVWIKPRRSKLVPSSARAQLGSFMLLVGMVCIGIFAIWDFPLSNPAVLINVTFLFAIWICERRKYA